MRVSCHVLDVNSRPNGTLACETGFTGYGKIPKVSFRGRGLPEESALFFGLAKKQIPRFARDNIKLLFSAAASACLLLTPVAASKIKRRQAEARPTKIAP